jgi:hypothetical protein
MATAITCPQVYEKTPAEVRRIAVDMRGVLRQGEVCIGTPTITVSGPIASSAAVNTTIELINGEAVDAGKAITFTISAGTAAVDYTIQVTCATSGSQTVEAYCRLKVRTPTYSVP